MHVREIHVNATENHYMSEPFVYEAYADIPGELFREMQREYGRCTSKVYVDTEDGETRSIGWVFERREEYSDVPETYMHQTWVEILQGPPVTTVHYDYVDI